MGVPGRPQSLVDRWHPRWLHDGSMLQAVTLKEIEAIFAVTDPMGISREALVIPLAPGRPGRVRRLPNGKLEIVVDAEAPLDEWLRQLPALIARAQGAS
jgi:hypothetical protein